MSPLRKWITYAKYNKLICTTVTLITRLSNYDLQDSPELRNIILFESESYQKKINWENCYIFSQIMLFIICDHYIH